MIHTNFYRKALFRQPVRTLILTVLLGALTCVFTSHAVESLVVTQEIHYLEEYYRPIGKLATDDWDVRAGQAIVEECPYLEFEDIRRDITGVLVDLQNADVDGRNFQADIADVGDVVFAGRLKGIDYVEKENVGGYYDLTFEVCSVEAGYEDYMTEGDIVHVRSLPGIEEAETSGRWEEYYYPSQQDEAFLREYEGLKEGGIYLLRACYYELYSVNGLRSAQRGQAGSNFILEPLLPGNDGEYFYEIPKGGEIDYKDPQLAGLSSYVDYLCHNQHVLNVIGTKDMSMMPICQESSQRYFLTDGRWLTREDDLMGKRVCVVHDAFARLRGLEIGDKLRLRLENMSLNEMGGYALWEDWEQWGDCEYTEEEFEIVGFYDDLFTVKNGYTSFYSLNAYVPDSCIPKDYSGFDTLEYGGENYYSFVLDAPQDQQRFLEDYRNRLEEAGVSVSFVENNGVNFSMTAQELLRSTSLSTLLFGVALGVTLLFVCGVYLMQRQREYAVARALGVPAVRATLGVIGTFGWIAVPGILAGSAYGWQRTMRSAKEILSPLEGQMKTSHEISLPYGWLALIAAAVLAAAVLFLCGGCILLTRQSVISLLQGDAAMKLGKHEMPQIQKEVMPVQESAKVVDRGSNIETTAAEDDRTEVAERENVKRGGTQIAAILRYMGRHILRAGLKSAMVLVLGTGAVLLFGWMYSVITNHTAEIERLYNTTVIEGEIIKADSGITVDDTGGGVIKPDLVDEIENSGLVREVYREETSLAKKVYAMEADQGEGIVLEDVSLLGIYDWDKFMEGTGKELSVQFYAGYDGAYFTREREADDWNGYEAILPETQMAQLAVEYGDIVMLQTRTGAGSCLVVGSYQGAASGGIRSDAVLVQGTTLRGLAGMDYYELIARITFFPQKNRELMEREEELKALVEEWSNPVSLRFLIWDEELHEAVEPMERTVSLYLVLYPVAIAVFAVLGFGFQLLLLMQRRKEAAIMRVLGSPAGRIGMLFGAEQLVLCLIGTAVGMLFLIVFYRMLAGSIWLATAVFILTNVVGIVTGSIMMIKRKPLELLQVRE